MQERFFVSSELRHQFHYIVDVILCFDAFVDIVCSGHHVVLTHCLLNNFALFHASYKAVVDS